MYHRILHAVSFLLAMLPVVSYGQTITNTLYNDQTFNAKTIDQSKPVGVIEGAGSVTLTGAATYTIPIKCPPGTNGMTPKIALTYNSQSGNGILGMGWNIEGLSSITRVPKNLYLDNLVQPITNTWNDAFALDGNRLISVNGSGPDFKLESDDFSTITTFDVGASKWFRVKRKDGTEMDYGSSTDSRLLNDGNTEVMVWRLKKIKDVNENYIEFVYTTLSVSGPGSPKNVLIDKIVYTKNDNAGLTTPYNEVKFNYASAPFTTTVYQAGSAILMNRLLTSIELRGENYQLFKTFVFNYGHKNVNALLKEIIEKDAGGVQLNSTIFKYGDMPSQANLIDVQQANGATVSCNPNFPHFFADLQGDGIKELIKPVGSLVNNELMINSFRIYQRDPSTGGYNFANQVSYGTSKMVKLGVAYERKQFNNHRMMDMDGDGREDIFLLELTPNSGYSTVDAVKLFRGTSTSSYLQAGVTMTPSAVWNGSPMANNVCAIKPQNHVEMLTGDFDGDNKTEVLVMFEKNSGGGLVDHYPTIFSYSSSSNTIVQASVTNIDFTLLGQEAFKAEVIDIDGDGRSEVLLRGQNKSVIYKLFKLSGGVNSGDYVASKVGSDLLWPTSYHNIYPGDFNGDGKTDLLLQWGNGAQWEKGISNGVSFLYSSFTDFLSLPKVLGVNTNDLVEQDQIAVGDFDGDGKSDITQLRGSNTNLVYTYLSRGDDFFPMLSVAFRPSQIDAVALDVNGDGRSDMICRNRDDSGSPNSNENYLTALYYFKDKTPYFLHKVKDGFSRITTFTYDPLTKGGTHYSKGNNATYPLMDMQIPIYTVKSQSQPDGAGGLAQTNYFYSSALCHLEGRGFLGFKKIIAENSTLDTKTESLFDVKTTGVSGQNYYFMAKVEDKQYLLSTNQLLGNRLYNIQFQNTTGSCFYQKINSTTQSNALTGASTVITNTYNNSGNITQSVVNVNNIETITTNTSYTTVNNIELPSNISVTKTRAGYASTDEVSFSYDSKGRPQSKTNFANLANKRITTYSYDNFGNIISETLSGTGIPYTATTTTNYDGKGRFPVSVTNPLSQKATTTWDNLWGQPLQVTGIDGVQTTNTYNSWGKLTSSTVKSAWLNIQYTVTYSDGWDLANGSVYYTKMVHPGRPDVKTWYDILGREISTETEHFNNKKLYTFNTYNNKGQLHTSVAPHLSSETGIVTTNTYNSYGLLASSTNDFGATTHSYSYGSGKTTHTVSSPKGQTITLTDAAGRVLEQTDNGGKIVFTYDSRGNVLAVKQGVITLLANSYDAYGRKVSLNDCDAGMITYEYDAWGRLKKETDAKGQKTEFQYNEMNMLLQRDGVEGTTTYEYYDAGSGYANQVKKVTGFGGEIDEFDYDWFGRLVQKKRTIDNKVFETGYSYNNYGDVEDVTYNTGFSYKNNYDANGFLTSITTNWPGQPVTMFNATDMNGFGQYTDYTYGNNAQTTNTYDKGFLTHTVTPGIQDMSFTFDIQTGNLMRRTDDITQHYEDFTCDNLNRLTSSTVTRYNGTFGYSAAPVSVTYDQTGTISQGNIIAKTDVGGYNYGGFPKHAVKYTDNTAGNISVLQQDITYTPFRKAAKVTENGYEQSFIYDAGYERAKSVLKQNGTTLQTRYYMGDWEYNVNGNSYTYYVPGGDGLCAIVEHCTSIYAPVKKIHYVYKDHLGSILTVTDGQGNIEAEQNFDAWGRFRDPHDWTDYNNIPTSPFWLYRGYTAHEHMPEFGLINMNGRMYDPILGRMLSPDLYVMGGSQGYNRYTYALNNPLKYTDPSGYFLKAMMGVVGFAGDFIANLMYGEHDALGSAYKSTTEMINGMSSFMQFKVYSEGNTTITAGFDPFNLGVSANLFSRSGDFTFNGSIGAGLLGGPSAFAGGGATYHAGDWSFSLGGSTNFKTYSASGGVGYDDGRFNAGYYQTYYGGSTDPALNQWNGGFTVGYGDFKIREENDFLAFGHSSDKGRTQALEISYGPFAIGSYVHTNDPAGEKQGTYNGISKLWGANKTNYDAWMNGKVFNAPLYFSMGGSRIGYSAPWVQDATQNYIHQSWFKPGNQHYYLDYSAMQRGFHFSNLGYNNPFSLYGF